MSQQNVEAVKRLFAAVVGRDQTALQEAYHPEIAIHEAPSMPYGGDYHGHEGALQHVKGYYQTWDALRPAAWQPHPPIFLDTTEDDVVVLWREEAVEAVSGSRIDLPALGVFKVRDGQIVESRMFQDTAAVRDLLADMQQQRP
jgi:ketosteroid isomerase-like protein